MAARAATAKFSKIVLASWSEFPYSTSSHGGVAQLGERLTGSQEVRGSIPLVSTRALNEAPTQVGAFNMRKPLSIGMFVEPGLKPGFFVSRREGPRTLHV